MRRRDLFSAAAGAVVATVPASGIAWAAIPGAGGVIDGCYQKVEGQLRVIDPGTDTCRESVSPRTPCSFQDDRDLYLGVIAPAGLERFFERFADRSPTRRRCSARCAARRGG